MSEANEVAVPQDDFATAQSLWRQSREADAGAYLRKLKRWELVLFTSWAIREFGTGEGNRIVDAMEGPL